VPNLSPGRLRAILDRGFAAAVLLDDHGLMISAMRRTSWLLVFALFSLFTPAGAAINPMASSMPVGRPSGDLYQLAEDRSPLFGTPPP
jgi:hypothetical protein